MRISARTQLLSLLGVAMAMLCVGADRAEAPRKSVALAAQALSTSVGEHLPLKRQARADGELMREVGGASDVGSSSVTTPVSTVRPARVLWMEVTAYCPCSRCCGPNAAGITASGLPVTHNDGRFVAADTSVLPFGSRLRIPGYHGGVEVPVLDRGGAIKGHKLDLYFPSHDQALQWGRQWVMVSVSE